MYRRIRQHEKHMEDEKMIGVQEELTGEKA